MSTAADLTKKLLLAAATTTVALLAAEVGLRVYQRVSFGIGMLSVFPDFRVEPMTYSPFLAFGPRVNYEIPGKQRPELSRFDARGFRTVDPIGPKPPGELRIVALGGSTTEDLWNASGRHWPWILEQRLSERDSGAVRVLNGGMSAYATPHTLIRTALDVTELEADVLLVMHNINDLTAAYHAIAAGVALDGHYTAKYLLRSYTGLRGESDVVWSRLARFVAGRLAQPDRAPPTLAENDTVLGEGVRIFQRNLRSIVAVARAHGIEPVLLTMPFSRSPEHFAIMQSGQVRIGSVGVGQLPERERMFRDLARYNQATRELGASSGVRVVDMAEAGPWDDSLFVDTVHLSDEGSEVFATRLAERLDPASLRRSSAGATRTP